MPITPGTKLGRYEVRAKVGESGTGEVYLAQDIKLDSNVLASASTGLLPLQHTHCGRIVAGENRKRR
jgi:hypothetical protein